MGTAIRDSVFAARTAGRGGRARTPGTRCAPGQIRLALLGGGYPAGPGIGADGAGAQALRRFAAATRCGARISARSVKRVPAVLATAGLARNGPLRHAPAGDVIGAGLRPGHGLLPGRAGVRGAVAGAP
jgi:hypothetical protein